MIRFIDMDDQISEGVRTFAFWDTVRDRFCRFCDTEAWETRSSFEDDFRDEARARGEDVQRFLRLIPATWRPYC